MMGLFINGIPAVKGQYVSTSDGKKCILKSWREPHSPSSSGKVVVEYSSESGISQREFYPSVIGGEFKKVIRFINSSYKDLFLLEDGKEITIYNQATGDEDVITCTYIDDTHFQSNNHAVYHICEFAERMERLGNTYEPKESKQIVPLPELKGKKWADRFLSFYESLGWDKKQTIDPTKVLLNKEDWKNIVSDLQSYTFSEDEKSGVAMQWVSAGASSSEEVQKGTVWLLNGWLN